MKKFYLLPLLFITACTATKQTATTVTGSAAVVGGKLFTSVFQQTAAEYEAICFQTYNLARLRLDQGLQIKGNKPKAIITDIDETVLDNSAYAVRQALLGKDYEAQS